MVLGLTGSFASTAKAPPLEPDAELRSTWARAPATSRGERLAQRVRYTENLKIPWRSPVPDLIAHSARTRASVTKSVS
jgi:hypothetical protein